MPHLNRDIVAEWHAQAKPHRIIASSDPTCADGWFRHVVSLIESAGGMMETATAFLEGNCLVVRWPKGDAHMMTMLY